MSSPPRQVRVTESFFEQLDALLPPDRGPNGEPSATDFLVIDLPSVVDEFSTAFDGLPEVIEGVPTARMLIRIGRLVDRFVVFGLEATDGSVDLIGLDLDTVALAHQGPTRWPFVVGAKGLEPLTSAV